MFVVANQHSWRIVATPASWQTLALAHHAAHCASLRMGDKFALSRQPCTSCWLCVLCHVPLSCALFLLSVAQDALCKAAVGAGLPESLVYGDTRKSPYPRLISAIHVSGGVWVGGRRDRAEVWGGLRSRKHVLCVARVRRVSALKHKSKPTYSAIHFSFLLSPPSVIELKSHPTGAQSQVWCVTQRPHHTHSPPGVVRAHKGPDGAAEQHSWLRPRPRCADTVSDPSHAWGL